MKIDFDSIIPPFEIGMGKDLHLIHFIIVFSGIFIGHLTFKYLSKHKERFNTFHIIAWIIIGIPVAYLIGFCLNMFLYPFQLEQPDISNRQSAFTSFYFMLFSIGTFIRGIWYHQKNYR